MAEGKHDKDLLDSIISPKVRAAIEGIQLALLKRATCIIDGDEDGEDNVDGDIEGKQLLLTILAAISGQTGNQQSNQQITQQVGEIIAALTGRTVTQTTHLADINGPERIMAAVARGVDNNELVSQRFNNIAGDVAQLASVGLGVLMTSTPLVAAQINSQIPDNGAKNSDVGRLIMDACKSGHSHCVPGTTPEK